MTMRLHDALNVLKLIHHASKAMHLSFLTMTCFNIMPGICHVHTKLHAIGRRSITSPKWGNSHPIYHAHSLAQPNPNYAINYDPSTMVFASPLRYSTVFVVVVRTWQWMEKEKSFQTLPAECLDPKPTSTDGRRPPP